MLISIQATAATHEFAFMRVNCLFHEKASIQLALNLAKQENARLVGLAYAISRLQTSERHDVVLPVADAGSRTLFQIQPFLQFAQLGFAVALPAGARISVPSSSKPK